MKEFLELLVEGRDLDGEQARRAMQELMSGRATTPQIAGFLAALKTKGETVDEIVAFAEVMRENAVKIKPKARPLVDTCGTGGDGSCTFNVSTCAAFVVAGAGVAVAKHGNRASSSKCGSADVLEALGVKVALEPAKVEKMIDGVGIGFLFAPSFHPAMKHAAEARRELGIKTVFNLLGPLTNPASAKNQLVGVYDAALTETMALALEALGSERALVVNGGIDEFSVAGETKVTELDCGEVKTYSVAPEDFGFARRGVEEVKGGNAYENAGIVKVVLEGKRGAKRDIVLLNAGAALYVSGKTASIKGGVTLAEESIDSGKAMEKLEEMVKESNA